MEEIGDIFNAEVENAPVAQDLLALLQESLTTGLLLEQQKEQLEADLKATSAALMKLKEQDIPKLMDQLGMQKVTKDNFEVQIDGYVRGSLPKDPELRTKAINWLVDHNQGGLIKTDIALHFGRNEHNVALDVAQSLRDAGHDVEMETGVHPQTLMAFGREALKNGDPLEPELLGLYVGRVAKFKKLPPK